MVLLLAQLLTAAYACPQLTPPPADASPASADMPIDEAPGLAMMPGCGGDMHESMDPDQPQLCKAHCEAGSTSVNTQPPPQEVPPALAWGAAVVGIVDDVAVARLVARPGSWPTDGPPARAAPIYLAFVVLRN